MLQDISRPERASSSMPYASVEGHPLDVTLVRPAVEDIVVIEYDVACFHLNPDLARYSLLKGVCISLNLRPSPDVRARDGDETLVIIQSQVPLRAPSRLLQPLELLLCRRRRGDVVPVPREFEIPIGPAQEVEKLEDQILILALEEFLDNVYDRGGEVVLDKGLRGGEFRVHHELHAPDALGGGVGARGDVPWRELLREGAYRGPVASAGDVDGLGSGGAEGGELLGGQDGGDEDEAVPVEGVKVGSFGHVCLSGCR